MLLSVMPEITYEAQAADNVKPMNVSVKTGENGLEITWDSAANAQTYKVYRAESRFSEYVEIGETQETTYTDTNPNQSKYSNYYKIVPYNDSVKGVESEPGSLEISMFGESAYVFSEKDDTAKINSTVKDIGQKQRYNQFGNDRYMLAFKPGDYTKTDTMDIGYYTQLMGLGKTPYDVRIKNVQTPAALEKDNVTCNFWVEIGNVTIADTDNTSSASPVSDMFRWGASQAAPARRLNVERTAFFQWEYQFYGDDVHKTNPLNNPWASGGFIADSKFAKEAGSWSQQQYYYRNCDLPNGVYGVNWNQVIQGCTGVTDANTVDNAMSEMAEKEYVNSAANKDSLLNTIGRSNWNSRGCTTVIDETSEMREKPFLYFDEDSDDYKVFIPAMRKNSQGVSWSENDMGKGTSISVEKCFYIANPDVDTAETINKELKEGKNIIFRPGVYHVSEPIQVTKSNTILMGLGMATIIPDNEETAIKVSDVGGVCVSDLLIDAGEHSETLLIVGQEGCNKDHSENPTVLHDVFYRVGGTANKATVDSCQVINSNDVIIDHTWVWRADHGDNNNATVGWTKNTAKNGLIVNGDNVTIYGLFVEHFQEYDIIWRGENGRTFFLQNEKCYDPQNQEGWMSHQGELKGYASYKVTNNVKKHYVVGLGIYDVFINTNGADIYLDNAIEVPNSKDVLIENACIVEIANSEGPKVGINHIINGTVPGIRTGIGQNGVDGKGGYGIQRLLSYNNGKSIYLPDVYDNPYGITKQVQDNVPEPSYDPAAEKDIKKDPLTKDDEKPVWEMTDDDYLNRGDDDNGSKDDSKDDSKNDTKGQQPTTKNDGQQGTTAVTTTLKKGQKFTVGKYQYKITKVNGKKGNVTLTTVVKKYRAKLKTSTVKATVSYKGYKFNVTVIGKKAFNNCKKLKKVTIGKNVKTISSKAFKGCKKLTRVTVGKNVKTISSKAFYSSSKLKQITLKGKKVKKVAKNAFHKKIRKTLKISGKSKSKKVVLKSLKRKK